MRFLFLLGVAILGLTVLAGCSEAASVHEQAEPAVTVRSSPGGHQLLRNGEPYFILGAGGTAPLEDLTAAGGNSIRTWDAEGIRPVLDRAHELGMTVTAGIWIEHQRHGYDHNDPAQRQAQADKVKRLVNEHKDHPALLLWAVGNEVTLAAEDVGLALRSVEEAAALVKSIDPNHPVMTVIPEIGTDMASRVARECPSVDILGVNSYAGLASLPERLAEQGYDGPYIVAEFGPPGHWEVGPSEWGAPFEPTSADKAKTYEGNYRGGILSQHPGRCLGSYVFLWGNKQEVTPTWYGMFLATGEALPTVDTMTELWTGRAPEHRAPDLRALRLSIKGLRTTPGAEFRADANMGGANAGEHDYAWAIRPESTDRKLGGDKESAPDEIQGLVLASRGPSATLRAPAEPGAYRVFLTVRDGRGKAATANLPFHVDAASD